MSLPLFYLLAFMLGFSFALLAGLYSAFTDDPAGDPALPAAATERGPSPPLRFYSPNVIASFLAGFGGTGILAHTYVEWVQPLEVAAAAAGGLLLAALTLGLGRTLAARASAPDADAWRPQALAGQIAEVSVPIATGGIGEVAYIADARRTTAAARTADGGAIPHATRVRVTGVSGSTLLVEPADETPTSERDSLT